MREMQATSGLLCMYKGPAFVLLHTDSLGMMHTGGPTFDF